MTKRVIFYLDGLNIHYGFKDKCWQELNWLNIVEFCKKYVPTDEKEGAKLKLVKYFTATLNDTNGAAQKSFLRVNEHINSADQELKIIKGVIMDGKTWCDTCSSDTKINKEKKTDVNIALQMLRDAVIDNECDISILMTNDVDIVPSIEMIREIKREHRVMLIVPPTISVNRNLQNAVEDKSPVNPKQNVIFFKTNEYQKYNECQLPEKYNINGKEVERPLQYNRTHLTKVINDKKREEKEQIKAAKSAVKNSESQISNINLENLKNKFNG